VTNLDESQNFKIGDWIILSDERTNELIEKHNFKREQVIKFARQVVNINSTQNNNLTVTRRKNEEGYLDVTSRYFRKATLAEIKKEQLRNLF
jgi:hypothetical protein